MKMLWWRARPAGHQFVPPEEHVAALRKIAEAHLSAEDALRHQAELQEARRAREEAERSLTEAMRLRQALRSLAEALRKGPQPQDRFADGMRDAFQSHRREDP
jgi:hypothetical protein